MVASPYSAGHNMGPTLWTYGAKRFGAYDNPDTHNVYAYEEVVATGVSLVWNLSTISGNPLNLPLDFVDEHECPSMCVDANGRLYIACNNWQQNVPRIVRSTTNESIQGWEDASSEFVTAPAAGAVGYFRFTPLPSGNVLCIQRERENNLGGDNPGVDHLFRSEVGTPGWQYIGELARGAADTEDAFYYTNMACDPTGRVHIFGAWDQSVPLVDVMGHSYCYSDDEGDTWHAVDGTLLTTPFSRTDASGVACRTGIDYGANNQYAYACSYDADFYPCGSYHDSATGLHLIRWNGTTWSDTTAAFSGLGIGAGLVHFRHDLWTFARRGTLCELRRVAAPNDVIKLAGVVASPYQPNLDPIRLRDDDVAQMLIADPTATVRSFGNHAKITAA